MTATKILCVDDEPFILNSIERIFNEEYDVFKATSPHEALKMLDEHDFDVIISDQRMPQMTGTEFLEKVRQAAPRAIRILLTGYADLEAVRSAVNEGEVFRYITKPWDNKDLRLVVYSGVKASRAGNARDLLVEQTPSQRQILDHFSPILVLDTDQQVFDTCSAIVGTHGSVHHAISIDGALKHLEVIKGLGIVVAAVKLGGENTELLIKGIKNFHPAVVTVLVSEMHDAELIVRLINEGQIFRCLFKPTKLEMMQRTLWSAQSRHRALQGSTELLARFQVPVPIEIAAATKKMTPENEPVKTSWTSRFAKLFSR